MKQAIKKKQSSDTERIVEEKLIENYAKYYRLAYSYVNNETDAQDIVQEAASDTYHDPDLKKAVDALEPLERTIIILRYFEDLQLNQIAEITKENINTVKTRLYRTLKKLNVKLSEENGI